MNTGLNGGLKESVKEKKQNIERKRNKVFLVLDDDNNASATESRLYYLNINDRSDNNKVYIRWDILPDR